MKFSNRENFEVRKKGKEYLIKLKENKTKKYGWLFWKSLGRQIFGK
jgi:hypothetical protein